MGSRQSFYRPHSVCPSLEIYTFGQAIHWQRNPGKVGAVDCPCVPCLCVDEKATTEEDSQCFMFRSRRSGLVKRLWKCRFKAQDETNGAPETPEELEAKAVIHSMLKRLKEKQLEVLVQSVESKGGETTDCVLLPKADQRLCRRSVSPHVLCCQVWRWPDLVDDSGLKRLSCCTSTEDPISICCNPFHWSRLLIPGKIHARGWFGLDTDSVDKSALVTTRVGYGSGHVCLCGTRLGLDTDSFMPISMAASARRPRKSYTHNKTLPT